MSDKENINGASLFKDLGINPEDFNYHIDSIDLYLKAMIVKELKNLNDGSVYIQNHLADIGDFLFEIK